MARTVPRLVFLGMIILGAAGATVVILSQMLNDPSTPRGYYLVPTIAWAAFLEVLLVVGWQLSRSRFAVWSNAFSPPFLRPRTFGPRLPPLIPFEEVERMVPETSLIREREHLDSLSVELRDGERFLVSGGDVGTHGMEVLLSAWSSSNRERSGKLTRGTGGTPPWVGREWRAETVVGLLFLTILLLEALLVFSTGNPSVVGAAAIIGVVALGSAFALALLISARGRRRRTNDVYAERSRL